MVSADKTIGLTADYATEVEGNDEMCAGAAGLRPHWQGFARALDAIGSEELEARRQDLRRLLRESGVSYTVYGDPQGVNRPWELDALPLLVDAAEWSGIEAGLAQRTELLDLVLKDLYGARQLISEGLLPLELVYAHSGFLRPCDQVRLRGDHQLLLYAADLARGPDGRMWVVGDRTQAPSGAGYALENRSVVSRVLPQVFRDCRVRRLGVFFETLRSCLARIAAVHRENPRVVVLTPGPRNETYFEHAYLATNLGYTLVQGDDLAVRNAKVWLKSLEGLGQVDVILRRLDDAYCDPLELMQESRLGVAGLLEAARRGQVAVANPLGSGVLETPALLPFLPGAARRLLDQDLLLPSVATWWCGQPAELKYVLSHLPELVVKPVDRRENFRSVFGSRLSGRELAKWRARIRAHPAQYVAQEQIGFSTAPALAAGRLTPRHVMLRGFVVAGERGYTVMPGGLARISPDRDSLIVTNQAGGISKDTWVLATEGEPAAIAPPLALSGPALVARSDALSSRVADNLYWVGRNAERAEGAVRLLRTVLRTLRNSDETAGTEERGCLDALLGALTHLTMSYPGFVGDGAAERLANPEPELLSLAMDRSRSGGLSATLQGLVQAAFEVRDLWSQDTWRVIDDIDQDWRLRKPRRGLDRLEGRLDGLLTDLVAFTGLTMESMTREQGWLLLDLGRRLERGMQIASLLRATLVVQRNPWTERLLLEAVLTANETLITHRRRYRSRLQAQSALDLMLLDETSPRSLAFQLARLQSHVAELPRKRVPHRLSPEERLVLDLYTRLRLTDTERLAQVTEGTVLRQALDRLLADIFQGLADGSRAIARSYFSHARGPQPLAPTHAEPLL